MMPSSFKPIAELLQVLTPATVKGWHDGERLPRKKYKPKIGDLYVLLRDYKHGKQNTDTFKSIRSRNSWTQADMAKLIGVSSVMISRWENGESPSDKSKEKIEYVLKPIRKITRRMREAGRDEPAGRCA